MIFWIALTLLNLAAFAGTALLAARTLRRVRALETRSVKHQELAQDFLSCLESLVSSKALKQDDSSHATAAALLAKFDRAPRISWTDAVAQAQALAIEALSRPSFTRVKTITSFVHGTVFRTFFPDGSVQGFLVIQDTTWKISSGKKTCLEAGHRLEWHENDSMEYLGRIQGTLDVPQLPPK